MIDIDELKPFLNRYCAVGVPHDIIEGKLFFYFGTLKNIDSDKVKIETKNGIKIIPIENIFDIHATHGGKDDRYTYR